MPWRADLIEMPPIERGNGEKRIMVFSRVNRSSVAGRLAAALTLGTATGAIAIGLAVPAHAQQSSASLRGNITTGSAVTEVTAVEVNTGVRRTAAVSANGDYTFASLRPGTYRLELNTANGVQATEEFTLLVAQDAVLDFDLTEAGATSTTAAGAVNEDNVIVVSGERLRTMEGGEVGINITQRLIEQLPQNNRNFLAFAELAPGVQFSTDGQGNTSLRGGAAPTASINVFIDGVSQKDNVLKNGVTGQDSTQGNPFPQLAIGEYRVISSNYKAEFDEVSSVAITAVTKSGTNEFHGEGFIDFTNEKLRDRIPSEIGGDKVKTKDLQFGGALGGPIIKDVAHFFVSYEGKRRRLPVEITPGLERDVSIFPSEYQSAFGPTNSEFNEDLYFGKIDLVPTVEDLFEISGKYRKETGFNLGSGSTAAESVSTNDVEEIRGLARWEHTADSWINDFKVSYEDISWGPTPLLFENGYQLEYAGPNPSNPATTQRGTLLTVGGGAGYQDKGQKGWTFQNDFTWIGLDRHTIKLGVKAKWIELNSLQLNFQNPRYYFNTAYNPGGGTFNDTIPYRLQFVARTGEGEAVVNSKNFQLGLYVQDDWEVTDRLTLNLGLRWDYERNPSFLNFVHDQKRVDMVTGVTTDGMGNPLYPNLANADYDINDYISTGTERKAFLGAFQPRIGFSYNFDDAGRYQIFGGYGRSYDRNRFDFLQQELTRNATEVVDFRFPGDPLNNCTPNGVTCLPWDPVYLTQAGRDQLLDGLTQIGGGGEFRFIDNDLKAPYSDQFSVGLRGQFGNLRTEVGFNYVMTRDGFAWLLGNRRPDGSFFAPDDPNNPNDTPGSPFGFAPPGYGSIIIGTNGAETDTKSLYLKLTKQYTSASRWSFDATYTYTDATENRNTTDSGAFSLDFPSIQDYPVVQAIGVPKHRFIAAASVDLPLDFALSGKFLYQSPGQVRQLLGTADPYDRLVIVNDAFGNGDRWGKRQMDVALTKYIRMPFLSDEASVRFRIDVINLFNDRNYINYNGNSLDDTRTAGSPSIYRERTNNAVGGNPPRTIKLTAGFAF